MPGAFELPLCARAWRRPAATTRSSASAPSCAARRRTSTSSPREAARGIVERRRCGIDLPVAFGVLTTDTIEQALARAGGEHGNKGYEAAVTALEMVQVLRVVQRA